MLRCVTMSRPIIKVFVLILLVSQVANIFGKLTILRGQSHYRKKRVMCFSEDDGGALVWNANLQYKYYPKIYIIDSVAQRFLSTCTLYDKQIDCDLKYNNDCLNLWSRANWAITNSVDTSMGLVFDQRWETFKEYTYDINKVSNIEMTYNIEKKTKVIPLSIRAAKDVHLLICNIEQYIISKDYLKKLCYWIIIGGWDNTRSVIRKCPEGVPPIGKYPSKQSECMIERDQLNHTALHPYEWRSFILTWNSETRNISLYDSKKLILTYRDTDIYNNINFKLFIWSPVPMLVRYHDYNFLYTSDRNATLSNVFYTNTDVTCLQMLIGLCSECDAVVSLQTSVTNEVLRTITVKGSSVAAVHGLPMWQSVKITVNTTTHSYSDLKVVVTTKLNVNISNPVWAIANVRRCPLKGCIRESVIDIYEDQHSMLDRHYIWPNVTCQKLFYEEQSVVNELNDIDVNVELDDNNCSIGYIGPACKFSCNKLLDTYTGCKYVAICNNHGCTCAPGYVGVECNKSCDNNYYGHACSKKCGSCLQHKQCDQASGLCHEGCENMENYFYAPPLCKIGISKPNETQIKFINRTNILATVPIKWEKKYEEIELLYSFSIKMNKELLSQHVWTKVSRNSTKVADIFSNLTTGAVYEIQCIFAINEFLVYGNPKTVYIFCDPIENLYVIPSETELTIYIKKSGQQLHTCREDFDIFLKISDDNYYEWRRTFSYFPYVISNLKPYTSYNITITNKLKYIFSNKTRTLEGVPSTVLYLKVLVLSSWSINVSWTPPERPNGEIKKYIIQSKIIQYFGCKQVVSPSSNYTILNSTSETEFKLLGLHPYARYSVQVIARNSRHSSKPAIMTFEMPPYVIPAVTFSRLKMQNWTLSWSPPEDCTTILGPLTVARIEIRGNSTDVLNFSKIMKTQYKQINLQNILRGAEQYVAKIFALRDYDQPINISAFEEYIFKTPPKEPPQVTSLEIVEIEKNEIHLRWHSPRPPLNGILHSYDVLLCPYKRRITSCDVIPVHLNETCSLWDDYMCKIINYTDNNIQVVAYNVNVSRASLPVEITTEIFRNTKPDPPHNLTCIIHDNSIINLKWIHPWRTGSHIQHFRIIIKKISSTLRNSDDFDYDVQDILVINYLRSYSQPLYLFPSSQYNISIQTVTIKNEISDTNSLEIRTPSNLHISGELEVLAEEFDSVILLHIPRVLNDTRDSITYIGIIEPDICKNRAKIPEDLLIQAGEERTEYVTQIAKNATNKLTDQVYAISNDESINCPLKNGKLYEIIVIITERNFAGERFIVKKKKSFTLGEHLQVKYSDEIWIICTILILAVVCAGFYFYKK